MALDLSVLDGLDLGKPKGNAGVPMRAPLSAFEEDPDNPRFEPDGEEFVAFVADVKARGILQPIVVVPIAGGKLRIRFGSRRYRAAIQLGLPDAPYVVTEDTRQFDDYAQVAENEMRRPMQPLELAQFIERKMKAGGSKKAIAKALHMDPSAVTHLLALGGGAHALILELYHSHRCRSPVYLYELNRLLELAPDFVIKQCTNADEINRRFIDQLASQVQKTVAPVIESDNSDGPATVRVGSRGRAGALDAIESSGSAPISNAPDACPSASTLLSPENGVHEAAPGQCGPLSLRKPELLGEMDGREVVLDIWKAPSEPERIWIRSLDGVAVEVPIASVRLTSLHDAKV